MPHFAASTYAATKPPVRYPRAFEHFRKRDLIGAEKESTVVAHAVLGRKLAGKDARVRGERQRGDRDRLLEQHAFGCQPIDRRRFHIVRAVGADAIGARRVERHDDQVQPIACDAARQLPSSTPAAVLTGRVRTNHVPAAIATMATATNTISAVERFIYEDRSVEGVAVSNRGSVHLSR